ncbi:MAG: hypothetical protein LAT68_00305 [Cyclobacteriaceae bacterium]|nr:hypothetical protein [Cyclobacteriaceae bacterium]MCH8514743.1 hypothetical protein [Cyclobacteriaceae bacterium]
MNVASLFQVCAEQAFDSIRAAVIQHLDDILSHGAELDRLSVKATHQIDEVAFEILKEHFKEFPADLYIESFDPILKEGSEWVLFCDPVDGSRNCDRNIGDAGFGICLSPKREQLRFSDLQDAFVGGLRTGDRYYTKGGSAFYQSALTKKEYPLRSSAETQLKNALLLLKAGYSAADTHFSQAYPLYFACKDSRSFENSIVEMCELARGGMDAFVEVRKLSDFYNLVAYPILRASGASLVNLQGQPFEQLAVDPDGYYDFVGASTEILAIEIINILKDFAQKGSYESKQAEYRLKKT